MRASRSGRAAGRPVLSASAQARRRGAFHIRSGFTLVELLVVIAIIALLAAALRPVLSRVKTKSKSTVCKSNLHQLGLALRMYLDDSGGEYPYLVKIPAANARGISCWFDALALPIPNAKWGEGVFRCPSYQGVAYEGESKLNHRGELVSVYCPCGSYAYNAAGRRRPSPGEMLSVSAGLGFSICGGKAIGRPVRENEIRAPADLYVLGDSPTLIARWSPLPGVRLGGAADYGCFVAENPFIEYAPHCVLFNMLFADAHTASVKTEVLLGTNDVCRSRWHHDNRP